MGRQAAMTEQLGSMWAQMNWGGGFVEGAGLGAADAGAFVEVVEANGGADAAAVCMLVGVG